MVRSAARTAGYVAGASFYVLALRLPDLATIKHHFRHGAEVDVTLFLRRAARAFINHAQIPTAGALRQAQREIPPIRQRYITQAIPAPILIGGEGCINLKNQSAGAIDQTEGRITLLRQRWHRG